MSDETIKKLNTEQESFIKSTEDLRQTICEKETEIEVHPYGAARHCRYRQNIPRGLPRGGGNKSGRRS